MGKHADSTDSRILRRIHSRMRGWVFTPDSFKDLGTRQAVDLALMRHRDSGLIRQLARGLYDYPNPQLGLLQPSTDDIAQRVGRFLERQGSKRKVPNEAQEQMPAERRAAMTSFCSCKNRHTCHPWQ